MMLGTKTIVELMQVAQTSEANAQVVREHIRGRVLQSLQHFFQRPSTFLDALRDHNAVVSGTAARSVLQSLAMCADPGTDGLHIYVGWLDYTDLLERLVKLGLEFVEDANYNVGFDCFICPITGTGDGLHNKSVCRTSTFKSANKNARHLVRVPTYISLLDCG